MARIRSVKPSLRTSRVVAQWPREVRYAWVLLWGYLDDQGRGLDIPKAIAGDCFPLDDDVTAKVMDRWLEMMATTTTDERKPPPLCRYEVAGARYIHALNWGEHQKPNRPRPSLLPACELHVLSSDAYTESFTESGSESATSGAEAQNPPVHSGIGLTQGSAQSRKSRLHSGTDLVQGSVQAETQRRNLGGSPRETARQNPYPPPEFTESVTDTARAGGGEGGDRNRRGRGSAGVTESLTADTAPAPRPPDTCLRHPEGTDDPCRACGRARKAAEAWDADQAQAAVDRRAEVAAAPRCPTCGNSTLSSYHLRMCAPSEVETTNAV